MADENSMNKLQIDVVVNDKDARQKLASISKSFGSFQKSTENSGKNILQMSNAMQNVTKNTSNAKREAGQFIEQIKKNSKNLLPSDLYGKSIQQYQKQLSNAQDKLKSIMASSTPDKQLKGLERYTIQAQMARNAIAELKRESQTQSTGKNFWEKEGWYQEKNKSASDSGLSLRESAKLTGSATARNDIDDFINGYTKGLNSVSEKAKEVYTNVKDVLDFEPTKLKAGQTLTKPYIDLEKQILKAEEKLENLYTKQELMSKANPNSERYKKLQTDIEKTEYSLNRLYLDMKNLQSTGGDVNTVNAAMQNLSTTSGKASEILSKMATAFRAGGLRSLASTMQSGSRNVKNLSVGLGEAANGAESLGGALTGVGSAIPVIGLVVGAIALLISVAKKAAKAISNVFKSIITGVKSFVDSITSTINTLFEPITKLLKKLLTTLRNTLIRRAVTAIIKDMGTAFQSLEAYSNNIGTNFHRNFQLIKADLQYIGRSIVAAFEPLINFAAPIIDFIVQKVVDAVNAINQFFNALIGSKTWTKAVYSASGYENAVNGAADAQKKLNKQLQKFDELNNITTNDKGGSGGGGAGGASGDGWSTEDVSQQAKSLADKFKDAWKSADFTSIGEDVATKIQEALGNIKWDNVQAAAIKLGSAFATFLNGFFGKEGFASDVGNAIANGVNAGINLLYTFSNIIKGDVIGSFVGTAIVDAIKGIKWEQLKATAGNLGEELAKGINALLDTDVLNEVSRTVANLLKTAIEGAYKFFGTLDFQNLGAKVADSINTFISEMNKIGTDGLTGWQKLGKTISNTAIGLEEALINLIKGVDKSELGKGVMSVITSIDWVTLIRDSIDLKNQVGKGIIGLIANLGSLIATSPIILVASLPSAEDVWDSFINAWDGLTNKVLSIGIKVNEKAASALSNVKESWKAIKKGTKNIKLKISMAGHSAFEKIKKLWDKISSKDISLTFNNKFTEGLKGAWNALVRSVNVAIDALNKVPGVKINKMQELKKDGGTFYGGRWHDIAQYAGGAPAGVDHGTMFIAGEHGAEAVANIGGRTEVLNQSQLASAMYSSVFNAMRNASGGQQPVKVYLDGKVVFDSTRQYAQDYTRRTGNPAFI